MCLQLEMEERLKIIGICLQLYTKNTFSNADGYTNSIYTITVAAMDSSQGHPPYSERCSATLISMYSNHGSGMTGIVSP